MILFWREAGCQRGQSFRGRGRLFHETGPRQSHVFLKTTRVQAQMATGTAWLAPLVDPKSCLKRKKDEQLLNVAQQVGSLQAYSNRGVHRAL